MSKTPEEMAEDWSKKRTKQETGYYDMWLVNEWKLAREAFLAGYKAAQDQLADADKVMPDSCEHILDMGKMVDVNGWISVKDRLPEYNVDVLFLQKDDCLCFVGWRAKEDQWVCSQENGMHDNFITRGFSHWMPLPEPPKEEK